MTDAVFWLLFTCTMILMMILKLSSRSIKEINEIRDLQSLELTSNEKDRTGVPREIIGRSLKGPKGFPIIGSLHLLRGPGGPFEAFTNLAKFYGDIYQIQLGTAKCVVVSSFDSIKEVLITKGNHFGGRPDFIRFHQLFGGDRNNSLALCDWSDLQRKRRSIARSFCSPRGGSLQQEELSRVAIMESYQFLSTLHEDKSFPVLNGEGPLKPLILAAAANMFTGYMCSARFGYNDKEFNKIVRNFDEIFWDINQGYAVDFMPWLSPFYSSLFNRLNLLTTEIRNFILDKIINPRRANLDVTSVPRDFTDALLLHLESPESDLTWDHIIFELEDFIGGHSAIGNLVMLILANTVIYPVVQTKIQEECDAIFSRTGRNLISMDDRKEMPYTEAVVWETLRVTSSPIVPHVATEDTQIGGYFVSKDTVVFVNNYRLNLDDTYWESDSKEFRPERFLKSVVDKTDGQRKTIVVKPNHFLPFSTGKRTCIGQRLVQGLSFVLVSTILSHFDVLASTDLKSRLLPGVVALPPDTFNLILRPRKEFNRDMKFI